ncbi:unnamed protein product [Miscanthus lutarioriparius]|uniref:Glycosyltransferase 61 catalytic domain-containing protein n=1 Tax=Miscanthus lutarioriparius TaxID=422564 RepID=A0A811S574_9POAL|nr:unnamed protein product [Miscanthus lutarioriparius]
MWLLLPSLLVLIVLKTDFLPQVARFRETRFIKDTDEMVLTVPYTGFDNARWQQHPHDPEAVQDYNQQNQILATNGPKDSSSINSDVGASTSKLTCNFSNPHSDTCTMEGDLRIHGKSAIVYVVAASTHRPENSTFTVRPYTRKWEQETMSRIREVTMRSLPPAFSFIIPPKCTVRHDVPAVVFSTGGCSGNFFHAMSDLIVPLYITSREYNGRVQFLITDYQPEWVDKFRPILAALSMYPAIDFDADTAVRCFPSAHVGLENHNKMLAIDPSLSRNGYTMMGFRDFLRSVFSLQRPWSKPISRSSGQRPRLKGADEREADAITAMENLGLEVVAARPDDVSDMGHFAGVVNSCDVMVGVHGAGLTNMVFLPHNGTVVQIVPWGGMKWACWYAFGEPVQGMGLRYVEYEATAEETTLKEKYPRDHPVFTDAMSIHRQGKAWVTFLDGQNVTLDIDRFRGVMHQVFLSITTE